MRFTTPLGFALAALAIPVIALHVLRPRRPRTVVSSTLLWTDLGQPVTSSAPWQRLRPSLALFLQLAMVAALALAAAGPARAAPGRFEAHTVFVIDASGSMLATDGEPDRIASARARAHRVRRDLPAGALASVIEAGPRPRVLLSSSSDIRAFNAAVDRIHATAAAVDLPAAFSLAEGLETPGVPLGVVLVSDGQLNVTDQAALPPGTRFERVGTRATNRGIESLAVEARGGGLHARVVVKNTGGPVAALRVRFDVDGVTGATVPVVLAPGATARPEVDLPSGDRVEAFLEGGDDLLAEDDHAFAVGGRRPPLKVLVVAPAGASTPAGFAERLLRSIPNVEVTARPEVGPTAGFDLAVYDGVNPPADLSVPTWAIAPPSGVAGVAVRGSIERPAVALVRGDDALLAGLDISDVAIATAQRLDAPAAQVIVGAEGGPLLLRGRAGHVPFVYMGFSLSDSNLAVQVAFPVLGDRIVGELAGSRVAVGSLRVGQPLPVTSATAAFVDGPSGTHQRVTPGDPVPIADVAGFWTIAPDGAPSRLVAVNADPAESLIAPVAQLPVPQRTPRPGEVRGGERSLLPFVVGAILVLSVWELWLSSRRRGVAAWQWRGALILRLGAAAALIGAVLGIGVTRTGRDVAVVFVVDQSASLGPAGRAEATAWARTAIERRPRSARAGVITFAAQARIEATVSTDPSLAGSTIGIDQGRTDLAAALRLAGAIMPSGARRRIVVVSDGKATDGDTATEIAALRHAGVVIDHHVIEPAVGPDVAVAHVDAPRRARAGERVTVRATVSASQPAVARVGLRRDGAEVAAKQVDLATGDTSVAFDDVVPSDAHGVTRYEVEVETAVDTVREDDRAGAPVQIDGAARVLVAEGRPGEGAALARALRAGGLGVDTIDARSLPPVDRLAGFDATVLVDVDVRTLASEQIDALTATTRDLGRGLVTVGGDQAYGVGGYLGSGLEALLPVTSDITDPKRHASVTEVLAIDASGSMAACHCRDAGSGAGGFGNGGANGIGQGGIIKTDIAKAGATRAVAALADDDQVGIIAFSGKAGIVLPVQRKPDAAVVTASLRKISPAGGTDILAGLTAAAAALEASKTQLHHIILFTDGFTDPATLAKTATFAGELYARGITVSVLATGETGAGDALKAVADAGHGRFYPGKDLRAIPQILAEEALLASRTLIVEGEALPRITGPAAAVRTLRAAPTLDGYVATTPKPAATTAMRIGAEDDPLLATWTIGLGRATSWTSDAGARWATRWTTWDGFVTFWTATVKETFSSADPIDVRTAFDGDRLRVTAETNGAAADGAVAVARIVAPDGTQAEVALERTGPSSFTADVRATATGTYATGVEVRTDGATDGAAAGVGRALVERASSPEYRPGAANRVALARASIETGGVEEVAPTAAFRSAGLHAGRDRVDLRPWLLALAALVWPVDVALRRLRIRLARPASAASERTPSPRSRTARRDETARPKRTDTPEQIEEIAEVEQVDDSTLGALLRRTRDQRGR